MDVLDRTQIELVLAGTVLDNIVELQAARIILGEDAADEIVVHRGTGRAFL